MPVAEHGQANTEVLVIDANILIRAVLGVRVRSLILKYGAVVDLCAPDTSWAEAREHLPVIFRKRGIPFESWVSLLSSLEEIIQPVECETYGSFEPMARTRMAGRDPDDWPVLATALAPGSPIWTEDNDFFGAGVATWTTDRVELFLSAAGQSEQVSGTGADAGDLTTSRINVWDGMASTHPDLVASSAFQS